MKNEQNCLGDNKNCKPLPSIDTGQDYLFHKNKEIDSNNNNNCNASTQCEETGTENNKGFNLNEKGYSYIFTIIYFFTSISMVFVLIIFNLISQYFFTNKPNIKITKHVPEFYSLKTIQPLFFSLSVLTISVSGLFNVWHFCSMLLQRFSVPELSMNKIIIHFMFIFGSFSHFIFIFFGFSPAIIGIETMKLKFIDVSLTMIIFVIFIIFNILFAILALIAIELLRQQNHQTKENLKSSVRMKIYVIFLAIMALCVYLFSIISHNRINRETYQSIDEEFKNRYYCMLKLVIFILPYLLYIINAFLNLTYYSDILKIQAHLNVFSDRDYFIISNDDSAFLI